MGQQQLLLIVLGVIIVGIAVAVGINMFTSSAVDSNRDAVTADLAHLASKAQQHLKKPATMGGGNGEFDAFGLNTLDRANNNGEFRLVDDDGTNAPTLVNASTGTVPTYAAIGDDSDAAIMIVGYGAETGRDGTNFVQAYTVVTANNIQTTIQN